MRQFHARTHFWRVDAMVQRMAQIETDLRARYIGLRPTDFDTPRRKRICRAISTYRIAGYLLAQEI